MDYGIDLKEGFMSKLMMDIILEAALQTKVESVIRWLEMGVSQEQIARGEDLDVRFVREIAKAKKEIDAAKRRNNPFAACHQNG